MTSRSLWLLLALVFGFGVPFVAVGVLQPYVGWPAAIITALVGLGGAAWAVRQSGARR